MAVIASDREQIVLKRLVSKVYLKRRELKLVRKLPGTMITYDYKRAHAVMPERTTSEPITIRTAKVAEIDALASALDRSRNYIVNQAIEQYLEANAWQVEKVQEGISAAREGRVRPAAEVFDGIARKHGWSR